MLNMDTKHAKSDDLRTALPALRKIYRRLSKSVAAASPGLGYLEILVLILFAESARRAGLQNRAALVFLIEDFSAQMKAALAASLSSRWDALSSGILANERLELVEWLLCDLRKNETLVAGFDECIAGYFYQFSCEENRRLALDRIQSADKKSSKDDLVYFTQLYTPAWVAKYLCAHMALTAGSRVIDPACGSGHMLLCAFESLLACSSNQESAIKEILQNLYGCDLDCNALWVCAFALILKARKHGLKQIDFRLNLLDVSRDNGGSADEFEPGSLEKNWSDGHPLNNKFDAVITNPPYIGRRLLDRRLKQFLKTHYPLAHHDISAAFLDRALDLCKAGGRVGFITQSSLLYLPSYGDLRKKFIANGNLESVVELGTKVFPLSAGEKINSMLIVLQKESAELNAKKRASTFLDLSSSGDKCGDLIAAEKDPTLLIHKHCDEFLQNREFAFNYRCPLVLSNILKNSSKLGDSVEIKQGLATSDNERFVRYFWDVDQDEIGKRWHPYIKGAGSERWHAVCQTVLDWGQDGARIKAAVEENYPYLKGRVAWVVKNEQYYFRKGLTFSFVSTGLFAVRRLPAGAIFDVGGSALFGSEENEALLLAYLNSSFAATCVQLLNPTFNSQVGDLKNLPLPEFSPGNKNRLLLLADEAFMLKSALNSYDETQINATVASEIDSIIDGAEPDEQWRSVKSIQEKSIQRLEAIEEELDALILDSIQSTYSCTRKELAELEKISLEKKKLRKPASPVFANAAEFASAVLRQLANREFSRQAKTAVWQENLSSVFQTRVSSSCYNWLEKQLSMTVARYMSQEFNKEQLKIFRGSPRHVAVLLPDDEILCLLSSLSLRELLKARTIAKLQTDDGGYKIFRQVEQRLKPLDDWTGKHLYQALY